MVLVVSRIVFRAAQERSDIEIVGINDLLDAEYMAYMLKYDSIMVVSTVLLK